MVAFDTQACCESCESMPSQFDSGCPSLHLDLELDLELENDRWTAGPLDRWTAGPLDRWTAGPLDRWTAGPLDRWTAGPLDRWTAGPLDRRRALLVRTRRARLRSRSKARDPPKHGVWTAASCYGCWCCSWHSKPSPPRWRGKAINFASTVSPLPLPWDSSSAHSLHKHNNLLR